MQDVTLMILACNYTNIPRGNVASRDLHGWLMAQTNIKKKNCKYRWNPNNEDPAQFTERSPQSENPTGPDQRKNKNLFKRKRSRFKPKRRNQIPTSCKTHKSQSLTPNR